MSKKAVQFPKDFLWGASTSAHQVEGGTHNQWTEWELENAKSLVAQASYQYGDLAVWPKIQKAAKDPNNYVSAKAAGHYTRYEEDFAILEKLQMNSFRFSIEWSRVEPEEGSWNVEAIEHYRRYLAALKQRDITPIMTLFHFTLPVWFSDKGGFLHRSNVKYFVRFVEKILDELGPELSWIITINEPEVYAAQSYHQGNWPPNRQNTVQMWRVVENLIHAHVKAAKRIHVAGPRYKVSMAYNLSYVYAGDDALLSRMSATWIDRIRNHYILRRTMKANDFIGVNYYFSDRVYGYRIHNPDKRVSDLGWDMQPYNLHYVLEDLSERYDKPIMITENGLADAEDTDRQWWLAETIRAMRDSMKNGVDLIGYMHWSLLDNFEWDKGFWPRFGLIEVDYATLKRTPRKSAVLLARTIKKLKEHA
ncbi:MAG TPA: glycoside hydrolase family 1 protein [Patescibacteria group bacterium]|jgi:beta-glucosidase|nr:glycoside hydrolase family 1 protein [Patescibacteria group bacterium]